MLETSTNIDDVLNLITDSASAQDIMSSLRRVTHEMEFENFTYCVIQPPDAPYRTYTQSTYAQEWKDRYHDARYLSIDPVVSALANRVTPFLWQPILNERIATGIQRQFFEEAKEIGALAGGSIPLRGPGRCFATLTVSSDMTQESFAKLWQQNCHTLHLLSTYAHEKMIPLIFSGDDQDSDPYLLTAREKECLVWIARGKSAWDVGEILNLSQRTIEGYLNSACAKLGVKHRIQAVVIAVMNNMIVP